MSISSWVLISKSPNSVTHLHNSIDNGSLSVAYESQTINHLITTISLRWSDVYAPHFWMCKVSVKSWKSLVD